MFKTSKMALQQTQLFENVLETRTPGLRFCVGTILKAERTVWKWQPHIDQVISLPKIFAHTKPKWLIGDSVFRFWISPA